MSSPCNSSINPHLLLQNTIVLLNDAAHCEIMFIRDQCLWQKLQVTTAIQQYEATTPTCKVPSWLCFSQGIQSNKIVIMNNKFKHVNYHSYMLLHAICDA